MLARAAQEVHTGDSVAIVTCRGGGIVFNLPFQVPKEVCKEVAKEHCDYLPKLVAKKKCEKQKKFVEKLKELVSW